MKRYRIVVIEPSPVIRQGLTSLLEAEGPGLSVAGAFGDMDAFRKSGYEVAIDIILVNPALVSFYRQFNVRELFSDHPEAALVAVVYGYVDAATLDSFDGALNIYDSGEAMAQKLRKIASDSTGLRGTGSATAGDNPTLSEREKEILVAVARGLTNKLIADQHNISIHTVISHRKNITRKTGIKTVSGLTMYAVFNNLVPQDEL